MTAKLAWFPFDTTAWMTNSQILGMTGEQMGAYLWLLCIQWRDGSLPYEPARVAEMTPKGISDLAAAQVLGRFFPPEPDTNERRNPKLAALREQQMASYDARANHIGKVNRRRPRKSLLDNTPHSDCDSDCDSHRPEKEKENTSLSKREVYPKPNVLPPAQPGSPFAEMDRFLKANRLQ